MVVAPIIALKTFLPNPLDRYWYTGLVHRSQNKSTGINQMALETRDYCRKLTNTLNAVDLVSLNEISGGIELLTLQVWRRTYPVAAGAERHCHRKRQVLTAEDIAILKALPNSPVKSDQVTVTFLTAYWSEYNLPGASPLLGKIAVEGGIELRLYYDDTPSENWLYLRFGCRHSLDNLVVSADSDVATCLRCGEDFIYRKTPLVNG
jgi:hypothetical protein